MLPCVSLRKISTCNTIRSFWKTTEIVRINLSIPANNVSLKSVFVSETLPSREWGRLGCLFEHEASVLMWSTSSHDCLDEIEEVAASWDQFGHFYRTINNCDWWQKWWQIKVVCIQSRLYCKSIHWFIQDKINLAALYLGWTPKF